MVGLEVMRVGPCSSLVVGKLGVDSDFLDLCLVVLDDGVDLVFVARGIGRGVATSAGCCCIGTGAASSPGRLS